MKFISLASLAAAVLILALGSLVWIVRGAGSQPDQEPVRIEIAGMSLRVSLAYVRRQGDLLHRIHDEFELLVSLPDLEPAAHRLGQIAQDELLVLTLRPADQRLPPADKPGQLYVRFLAQEAQPLGDALHWQRFQAGSPYEGEALALTPPEGRLFWARCLPDLLETRATSLCLSEMRWRGLDLTLRFHGVQLDQWQVMQSLIPRLMERLAQ